VFVPLALPEMPEMLETSRPQCFQGSHANGAVFRKPPEMPETSTDL
jgi:hypothetical protein